MAKFTRAVVRALAIRRREPGYWNWYLYHHI
jgi:hypothetical protein